MNRSRLALPLVLLALALAQPAFGADSASKVIGRHRKAVGGNALKRVTSTFLTGSVKSSEGQTGRFTYQIAAPDRLRTDLEVGGARISECYNGKSAWRLDARGLRTLLGPEAKRLRLESLIANTRLQDLSRNRLAAKAPVKLSIDGRDAYAIEIVRDDVRSKLFFDAATSLVVRLERERSDGIEEISYGDYRKVDGVMEPFSIRIKSGAAELAITVDKVEHNRSVLQAEFRHPDIEGAGPLPDLEVLMKAIISNQEKIEELVDRYTFRMTQIERKEEKNGELKNGDTRVFEITPVHGRPVRRLISINGKDLAPSEREKEDKQVQKRVEELIKEHEKEKKQEAKKEEQPRKGGKASDDEDDDVSLLDFLRISEITSVRREMFRGQEVIAFDYEPRKGFKPRTRGENLVNKLAGTMWVDEKAQQVARIEARLTDSFKMVGGLLASISPSSAFVIEQEKIGDEVWLPSYTEINMSARLFLLAKLKRNFVTRYSDYRKYQIDDKYELEKPKETTKPH